MPVSVYGSQHLLSHYVPKLSGQDVKYKFYHLQFKHIVDFQDLQSNKKGFEGLRGPKIEGYWSLFVIIRTAFFCRIKIFSSSVEQADPQTSIAYTMCE